jgi:hypothetical protein
VSPITHIEGNLGTMPPVPGSNTYATSSMPLSDLSDEPPPKVTRAEEMLYGDFAAVVRLLGTGSAAIHHAGRIMARQVDEARQFATNSPSQRAEDLPESKAWGVIAELLDQAIDVHRKVAAEAILATKTRDEQIIREGGLRHYAHSTGRPTGLEGQSDAEASAEQGQA